MTDLITQIIPSKIGPIGAHASNHETGGSDEIDITDLAGQAADPQIPDTHFAGHLYDGADNVPSLAKTVRKSANETVNNSAVMQDDDELLFAVAANTSYYFELFLIVLSQAAADIKLSFTMPAGGAVNFQIGTSEYTAADTPSVSTDGGDQIITIRGIARNSSTAGNCTLQWAQNAADASDTIVKTPSLLKYSEIQ